MGGWLVGGWCKSISGRSPQLNDVSIELSMLKYIEWGTFTLRDYSEVSWNYCARNQEIYLVHEDRNDGTFPTHSTYKPLFFFCHIMEWLWYNNSSITFTCVSKVETNWRQSTPIIHILHVFPSSRGAEASIQGVRVLHLILSFRCAHASSFVAHRHEPIMCSMWLFHCVFSWFNSVSPRIVIHNNMYVGNWVRVFLEIGQTHLACCGPVLPMSCAELAVTWKSAMAPDSMPKGLVQVAGRVITAEYYIN